MRRLRQHHANLSVDRPTRHGESVLLLPIPPNHWSDGVDETMSKAMIDYLKGSASGVVEGTRIISWSSRKPDDWPEDTG